MILSFGSTGLPLGKAAGAKLLDSLDLCWKILSG
jgi:hypothetical protein